jgi:hypothetical protein
LLKLPAQLADLIGHGGLPLFTSAFGLQRYSRPAYTAPPSH